MPDIWFDVDTAIAECPVNVMPLIDDTDFKTIEDAVAYNAAGMALHWHFVTSGGAYTVTAVTPTTAGNYDWTDQGTAGIYTIEIPASGGASINNDTEGYGWFTGVCTGVLPWRGPVIGFRAAALNDALCDGGDNLDVNTVQWLGTACATPSVAGVPEVDLTHVAGATTNVAALATNVDAILTDTADMQPKLGTPAGASVSADIAAVKVDTAAILADTGTDGVVVAAASKTGYSLTATTGLGNQTANITGNLSGSVGSVTGAVGSVTGNVGGNVAGSVGSVTGLTASDVGAIKAKTDGLTFTVAGQVDSNVESINTVTITGDGGATPFDVA